MATERHQHSRKPECERMPIVRVLALLLTVALTGPSGASLLWVRFLTTVTLSRAYPFAALAFVLVPAAGYLFFHEPITLRYALGTALIVVGVAVDAGA